MASNSIWWQGVRPDVAALNAMGRQSLQAVLGIEVTDIGDDWLAGRMPVEQRVHQPWGRLHGGASVVMAETFGTMGALHTIDPAQFMAVGMEINANHVRPMREGWLRGVARPESRGRTSQVWTIRMTDEQDRLVCISRFTAAVIQIERT